MKEIVDLRQMSLKDLQKDLLDLRKEQFNLRMQQAIGQGSKPHLIKRARRQIARLKMVMHEKRETRAS